MRREARVGAAEEAAHHEAAAARAQERAGTATAEGGTARHHERRCSMALWPVFAQRSTGASRRSSGCIRHRRTCRTMAHSRRRHPMRGGGSSRRR